MNLQPEAPAPPGQARAALARDRMIGLGGPELIMQASSIGRSGDGDTDLQEVSE